MVPIGPLVGVLAPIIGDALDRFFPNKEKSEEARRAIEYALIQNAADISKAQIMVNMAEAQHRSIWVSGWRPMVGWTCASALAWHFVGVPVITFAASYAGYQLPELPTFDMGTLTTILMGMLGLGGLRTFEKLKGLTK